MDSLLIVRILNLTTAVVVLVGARLAFRYLTPYTAQYDLVDEQNPAVAVLMAGFMLGVGIAISGALFGRDVDNRLIATVMILGEGVLTIALTWLGLLINDRVVLRRFRLVRELQDDRNLGAAFCAAGSLVSLGLILNGALAGFSDNFWLGLRDVCLYFVVGQLLLVGAAELFHWITRYDVHQLIEFDDNVAVGLEFGAVLVCIGLIARAAIVGSGLMTLSEELIYSATVGIVGIAFLLMAMRLIPRLVAPRLQHEEEVEMRGNLAVSITEACLLISSMILFSAAFQRGW